MKTKKELQAIIDKMSIDKKVGQLFVLAYPGKNPEKIKPLIQKYGLCGCYISQDNAKSFKEARNITKRLQDMSRESNNPPLICGVDQEGAWGVLIPESHPGPGNMALAKLNDLKQVERMYELIGNEMSSVGYNTILGPCSDINQNELSPIIGTRSFGEDVEVVSSCVQSAVKGLNKTNALSCLKHYPGHGATEKDTHRVLPEVNKTLDELLKSDLVPFQKGIEEGCDIIMTAHIKYPKIDKENPATLSSVFLNDILREKFNFKGIVLTDSMNMGAIRKVYNPAKSTLLALQNGGDVVMLSEEHYDFEKGDYLTKQIASLELVKNAIINGVLSEEKVNEKLLRILDLKYNKMKVLNYKLEESEIKSIEQIEEKIANKCPSLLQKNYWPLPNNDKQIICINSTPKSSYDNIINSRGIGPNQEEPAFETFYNYLAKERNVKKIYFEEVEKNLSEIENTESIVVVTEDYPLPGEDFKKDEQQKMVKLLSEKFKNKMIILGLRNSYELKNYPKDVTYVCTYSSRTCVAKAAAKFLIK